jgi:hypothetical protein
MNDSGGGKTRFSTSTDSICPAMSPPTVHPLLRLAR